MFTELSYTEVTVLDAFMQMIWYNLLVYPEIGFIIINLELWKVRLKSVEVHSRPPRMCYFGMWIILSWRQSRSCRLMRNFYLSLKEFKLGALPIMIITRNDFLWQGKLLITQHLFHLPSFLLSEVPRWSLAQNVIYTSYSFSVFESLLYVGFPCVLLIY